MLPPTSQIYWGFPGYAIFWILFVIAFVLSARRLYVLLQLLHLGQEEHRLDNISDRIKSVLKEVALGRCSLRYATRQNLSGVGHAFMVWGFSLFIVGYVIFMGIGGGFGVSAVLPGSKLERAYFSVLDIVGLLVIIGIALAAIKRYLIRPSRLEESTKDSGALLPLLLTLMFTLIMFHYCIEGFGYAAYHVSGSWPPIGTAFARYVTGSGIPEGTLVKVYRIIWWLNYGLILVSIVHTFYTKHLHPLFAPANIFFKILKENTGILKPVRLEEGATFGASKIRDLTWKQLLDLYACTDCGRCQENCPAYLTGKPLSPWKVIKDLRNHLLSLPNKNGSEPAALVEEIIKSDEIWACTTCLGCQKICPVHIEHLHTIMELRRNQVLEQTRFPPEVRKVLRNLEIYGDPLGMGKARRLDWARELSGLLVEEGRSYEYLIFVGCGAAFFDRNQETVRILAKTLVDNGLSVGILGKEELCCGDPIRRIGNEFLFQQLALKNISLFRKYEFKKIITACPHCFNTLQFEYPDYGGDFEVIHHTQFLSRLLEEGKLTFANELKKRVVFHDPCYLGRYNSIYDPPRKVMDAIPGLVRVEMTRSREQTFCCGGGGGRFWMEERLGQNINQARLEQTLEERPEMIITACPFCASMFEDALSLKEGVPLQVLDIIQLVKEAGGLKP